MHDVGSGARSIGVGGLGASEMSLASEKHAVFADTLTERPHTALERIRASRIFKAGADLRPLEKMGAVTGAAPRHAVDLEVLISPLARSDAVNLAQVVDHLGMRRVDGEFAVPG